MGLLWMAVLTLITYPHIDALLSNDSVVTMHSLYDTLPASAQLGVVTFAAYCLGIITTNASRDATNWGSVRWRRFMQRGSSQLRV